MHTCARALTCTPKRTCTNTHECRSIQVHSNAHKCLGTQHTYFRYMMCLDCLSVPFFREASSQGSDCHSLNKQAEEGSPGKTAFLSFPEVPPRASAVIYCLCQEEGSQSPESPAPGEHSERAKKAPHQKERAQKAPHQMSILRSQNCVIRRNKLRYFRLPLIKKAF